MDVARFVLLLYIGWTESGDQPIEGHAARPPRVKGIVHGSVRRSSRIGGQHAAL